MNEACTRLQHANLTAIHRAVCDISQAVVAERSGLSPTLVSRLLSGKDSEDEQGGAVHRVLAILAACNLTVVPQTYRHVDPDEYRAMQILASKRLREDV